MANNTTSQQTIGEINPGLLNPTMTPGHNNAVYTYARDIDRDIQLGIEALRLIDFWDATQKKYKYGVELLLESKTQVPNSPDGDTNPGEQSHTVTANAVTNNFYWQGGTKLNQPLCKIGIAATPESSTDAIVFFDTNSATLPVQ